MPNQRGGWRVIKDMAHWKHPDDSEYARLRTEYDAAFMRLRAAAGRLCSVLESSPDPEAQSDAHRRMEQALADYRESRDRLARYLGATRGASGPLRTERRPTVEEIRELAYRLWEQAGRPAGTAEQDWQRAEELLHS